MHAASLTSAEATRASGRGPVDQPSSRDLPSVAVGAPITVAAPPIGVGVQVAFAAWAAALQRHVVVVQRVVRDPPDPEFRSATNVGPPRFDLEPLAREDFGRASVPAIESLLRASSLVAG